MNRLLKTISLVEYFAIKSWEWSMNNMEMLIAELGPEDQQLSADFGWDTLGDPESLYTIEEVTWPCEGLSPNDYLRTKGCACPFT